MHVGHPQPLERCGQRRQQGGLDPDFPWRGKELRADDDALAAGVIGTGQAGNDAFALAVAVHFGGIEEGDARIDRRAIGVADRLEAVVTAGLLEPADLLIN
jgi:hypothetical protein